MARLEELGTTGVRATRLRPEIIIIDWKKNYRDRNSEATKAHIAWLKESIKAEGVKKPIDVTYADGKVYLEAGYCRLTAAQQARKEGWDGYIDALPVKGDEATRLAKSIIDNTGLPPTLLELGNALQQLLDWKWPMDRVAACVPPSITPDPSKALRVAKKALALNAAPLAVKEAVRSGVKGVKISEGLAVAASKKGPLVASQVIEKAADDAKAKGETVARREKGAGTATKAKAAEQEKVRALETIGDAMAEEILSVPFDLEKLENLAKEWLTARGR
jgi:hypothetical protein